MSTAEHNNELLVGKLRKELDSWAVQRWVLVVVCLLCLAAWVVPGGTAPMTVKGGMIGLGVILVAHALENWRGEFRLRILLELAEQLAQQVSHRSVPNGNSPDSREENGTGPIKTS